MGTVEGSEVSTGCEDVVAMERGHSEAEVAMERRQEKPVQQQHCLICMVGVVLLKTNFSGLSVIVSHAHSLN